ncbi:unnamed protein product [Alopecurus aequalis]
MIGDAGNEISKERHKAISQKNDVTREIVQGRKDDVVGGFNLEVSLLCQRISEQLGDLLSLFPTNTKEEEQRLIPILQSICRDTMRFCASHGQPVTELEEAGTQLSSGSNKEEEGQAEEVVDGEFSIRTGEHQMSRPARALFSPMLFTHCTPGFIPVDAVPAKTVQICSIKVAAIKHFSWPLEVYGVVAARDVVDKRRNPLFLRPRNGCQVVDEKHPFLHLTGPVRAILSEEPVDIEIQLVVKGTTTAEDRPLISYAFYYEGDRGARVRTTTIEKYSCTLELCTQQLNHSVQATIFGVHIVDHKWMPFEYGFKIFCISTPRNINESPEVVLFDSKVGRKCSIKNGFLNLSRKVISVEMRGKMKVMIQAYSQSGDVAAEGHVFVVPKKCNTSEHELHLAGFKVMFTVAWSLMVEDEELMLMNGMADPFALLPPMPPCLLKENGGIL